MRVEVFEITLCQRAGLRGALELNTNKSVSDVIGGGPNDTPCKMTAPLPVALNNYLLGRRHHWP